MTNEDTFTAKRDVATRLMASKGVRQWKNGPPLLYRLLWWCGLQVRPPHFLSFQLNFVRGIVIWCTFFGPVIFLLWPYRRSLLEVTVLQAEVCALALGVAAALGAAFEHRYYARKYNLPVWSELCAEAEVFE